MNRIFVPTQATFLACLTLSTFLTFSVLFAGPAFGQAGAAVPAPASAPAAEPVDGTAGGLVLEAERARIQAERASVEDIFTQAQAACYRKFAVADCQSDARLVRREALADLRRQEVSVNAMLARRQGAEALSRIDKKSSAQAGPQGASERAIAVEKQEARQASADEKALTRAAAERDAGARTSDATQRVDKQAQAVADRSAKAAAAAVKQQKYELKQKQAQEREVQRRKRLATNPGAPA